MASFKDLLVNGISRFVGKAYFGGGSVPISVVPYPERSGGAINYNIYCIKAISSGNYSHRMCFFRLGANAINKDTQFQFNGIKAYKLGCIFSGENNIKIDKNSIYGNNIIEY